MAEQEDILDNNLNEKNNNHSSKIGPLVFVGINEIICVASLKW